MTRALVLIAALLTVPFAALAHGLIAGDVEIIHPNIPQPPEGAATAVMYMGLANGGQMSDRLIGVEMPVARQVSLHESVVDADGVARMAPLDGVDIPAGETVLLEPGGMHVMLMGLTQPLKEGDMVPAVLIFEHAGRIELEVMVDPPGGMDHSTMDHGAGN